MTIPNVRISRYSSQFKKTGVALILRLCWSNFYLITTDWRDSIVNYEKYNSLQAGLF